MFRRPSAADTPGMATPLLAAALIVKDESANLPGCLAALRTLRPLLDHVVVYDTGSSDDGPEIARASGARVEHGSWEGDFSLARNAAVSLTHASWVLSVDADERIVADVPRLRGLLTDGLRPGSELDALWIPLVNIAPDGGEMYAAPLGRIFRPDRARFVGRLHEQVRPIGPEQPELRIGQPSRGVVHLRHEGYRDAAVVRAKAERNLEIASAEVAALERETAVDDDALARALYHRGRTLLSAGRIAPARADLERLAALSTPVPERTWGRDVLAQLLLAVGEVETVPALVTDLRGAGVDPRWCAWLEAQVLLGEDRYAEALPLLRTVDVLVDAVGREHDLAPVVEAQLIAAGRVGAVDEAAACCIRLMAGFGRADGLGSLLVTLWGARPAEWLVDLLRGAGRDHLTAVAAELRRCESPGPEVAAALIVEPAPVS
jgi:hypothetical protein